MSAKRQEPSFSTTDVMRLSQRFLEELAGLSADRLPGPTLAAVWDIVGGAPPDTLKQAVEEYLAAHALVRFEPTQAILLPAGKQVLAQRQTS